MNLLSLEDRHLKGDLIQIYKIVSKKLNRHNPPRKLSTTRESRLQDKRLER